MSALSKCQSRLFPLHSIFLKFITHISLEMLATPLTACCYFFSADCFVPFNPIHCLPLELMKVLYLLQPKATSSFVD